jgi:plasmid stabilization system protein ParE
MDYKIIRSLPAELDLDAILDYLVNTLQNRTAAKDFLDKYEKALRYLPQNPRIYASVQDALLAGMGYRRFIVGNYVTFYRVDEQAKQILIIRIFHQSQDYLGILGMT